MNSSELIVKCKHKLTLVEELSAKGMTGHRVLTEVSLFVGLARELGWVAEDEHRELVAAESARLIATSNGEAL